MCCTHIMSMIECRRRCGWQTRSDSVHCWFSCEFSKVLHANPRLPWAASAGCSVSVFSRKCFPFLGQWMPPLSLHPPSCVRKPPHPPPSPCCLHKLNLSLSPTTSTLHRKGNMPVLVLWFTLGNPEGRMEPLWAQNSRSGKKKVF